MKKGATPTSFWSNPRVVKIWEILTAPVTIGLYVTLFFSISTYRYYELRSKNVAQREPSLIYDLIERIEQKTMDARFKVRGERASDAPVALLTIDDRSIDEIGRWPWSREKTAHVIEKIMAYGGKAVGFDIVFSEPQTDDSIERLQRIEQEAAPLPDSLKALFELEKKRAQPDQIMAEVFSKNSERLVLGAFNEESHQFRAYQDYCRNSAFKRSNAEKFIKMTNISFVVDDVADPFVDLDFDLLFDQIFPLVENKKTAEMLKDYFRKEKKEDLTPPESRKLRFSLEEANNEYCEHWLTPQDPYQEATEVFYSKIFEKSALLKSLSLTEAIKKFKAAAKVHPVVQHSRWTINTDLLQENINFTGSFNAEQDSDGTIRKASMFFRTGNKTGLSFIPSLALQTYLVATGYRADVEIDVDPKDPSQKVISKFVIKDPTKDPEVEIGSVPVDEQGQMKINYAGGRNMFPYVPAKEFFNENPQMEVTQLKFDPQSKRYHPQPQMVDKANYVKGRTFIFGATAIGVYDLRVTPFEKNYPGPETHLTTLANLFDRNFIRTSAREDRYMLTAVILLGIALSLGIAQAGAILGFAITFLSCGAIFFIDKTLFHRGFVATTALPAVLVFSLYLILTFYKYFTEERKKKALRTTFSKYVSPAIVDEILKDPKNIELGGKKQRMSVFFSDVRGFTTISESLEPTVLGDVLNMYLTPMTNLVFFNKGTLDKYMGDAVMAFFGAPIAYADHAKYACRCALQSIEKLKELQKQFQQQGLPNIDIGIGVNTGEMSVGNMGSETVRSYTVMGDAVNLASRLEGINKEYGTRIIISEFTQADVKDTFTTREVDWVRVKGKNKPVRIFELINEGPPTAEWAECLKNFKIGFELFHERKFTEAKVAFADAEKTRPGDSVCLIYQERCEAYLQSPPSEDWDGVFVMKTK